jgi:hypothetical protein
MAQRLQQLVGARLLPSIVFDDPTIRSLAEHLSQVYSNVLGGGAKGSGAQPASDRPKKPTAGRQPARKRDGGRANARVLELLECCERGSLSLEETISMLERESA